MEKFLCYLFSGSKFTLMKTSRIAEIQADERYWRDQCRRHCETIMFLNGRIGNAIDTLSGVSQLGQYKECPAFPPTQDFDMYPKGKGQ